MNFQKIVLNTIATVALALGTIIICTMIWNTPTSFPTSSYMLGLMFGGLFVAGALRLFQKAAFELEGDETNDYIQQGEYVTRRELQRRAKQHA